MTRDRNKRKANTRRFAVALLVVMSVVLCCSCSTGTAPPNLAEMIRLAQIKRQELPFILHSVDAPQGQDPEIVFELKGVPRPRDARDKPVLHRVRVGQFIPETTYRPVSVEQDPCRVVVRSGDGPWIRLMPGKETIDPFGKMICVLVFFPAGPGFPIEMKVGRVQAFCHKGITQVYRLVLVNNGPALVLEGGENTPQVTSSQVIEIPGILLKHGAEVNARNKKGETVLDQDLHPLRQALLRKHGAKTGAELDAAKGGKQ